MVRQKGIHSWPRSLISHCPFALRQTRKSPGARDLVAHQRFPKNLAPTARECEFSQHLRARGIS